MMISTEQQDLFICFSSNAEYVLIPTPEHWDSPYLGVLLAHKHLDPSDREGTIPVAHHCAALGHIVVLLPVQNGDHIRTPDAIVDSLESRWEFKHTLNASQTSFKAMLGQANSKADVLWVLSDKNIDLATLWRYVRGKFLAYQDLQRPIRLTEVFVMQPDKEVHHLTMADVLKSQRPT